MTRFCIGIDEAGRGPIAGPVAVAAFCVSVSKHVQHRVLHMFPDGRVRDSKQLTPDVRERIFKALADEKKKGGIRYAVSFTSAAVIDRKGISFAIRHALSRSLRTLALSAAKCEVRLDGGLKAPSEFVHQKTIIKGDEKEAVVALASIVAKVSRDKKMIALAKKHPQYGFDVHKGYGTKAHYRKIRRHGLSPIHRRSFLKNLAV